uniref:MATH domain-containing protein n=1 Tax=Amphimedon queenslandica TaxID=400682 RepID=A0A1X7UYL3_AMPQE
MISCVGCNIVLKREDLEKHNEESMKEHLDIAMKKIDALQHSHNQKVFMLPDYTKKKEEGENWDSPCFYTSPGGYKMLLHVRPNGDGCYKGTHVSCFIYLKKGKYDDRLEWPFQGEVTIELLNQLEDKNHWEDTLLFDESTEDGCKQRDSTLGWGTPNFVSYSAL